MSSHTPRRSGLPSAPKPRSLSQSQGGDRYQAQGPLPDTRSRQVKPQKSVPALPNSRIHSRGAPPPHSYDHPAAPSDTPSRRARPQRSIPGLPKVRPHAAPASDSHTRHAPSMSSGSSDTSSLLNWGDRALHQSPRTSIDDDDPNRPGKAESLRQRRAGLPHPSTEDSDDNGHTRPTEGRQLWQTVTAVANTLTLSVTKAWATKISTHAGEETPPGQESRLSRAMKAYYLEKARDTADLPHWLFEPHERGVPRGGHWEDEAHFQAAESPPESGPRGLRNIFQAAASTSAGPVEHAPSSRFADAVQVPSKAHDRLKALRDAKRIAHVGQRYDDNRWSAEPRTSRRDDVTPDSQAPAHRNHAPGLPTRHGRSNLRSRTE